VTYRDALHCCCCCCCCYEYPALLLPLLPLLLLLLQIALLLLLLHTCPAHHPGTPTWPTPGGNIWTAKCAVRQPTSSPRRPCSKAVQYVPMQVLLHAHTVIPSTREGHVGGCTNPLRLKASGSVQTSTEQDDRQRSNACIPSHLADATSRVCTHLNVAHCRGPSSDRTGLLIVYQSTDTCQHSHLKCCWRCLRTWGCRDTWPCRQQGRSAPAQSRL
jgi:hypothetical protein